MLNCTQKEQYTIYPYVHSFVNKLNLEDVFKPIKIPDVIPT